MPWGLKRYQQAGALHFITFSCYRRQPLLASSQAKRVFEQSLERVRVWYGLFVAGYVIMPEHVHLLLSEPERSTLAVALQMLKQITAQKLRPTPSRTAGDKAGAPEHFWQAWCPRFASFVWTLTWVGRGVTNPRLAQTKGEPGTPTNSGRGTRGAGHLSL